MLQTKELVKVYKPKAGVAVTALDKVSITFPDKGMVFLLGKSGSGKSTLLNLLGGLDTYTDGEIVIKGVSSKFFRQKHFDSYRNTYVGFIFQEYNVLDEFTVGANIAVAIELQGRKATDEEINGILKEVDLEGFGNRKPNELSGGQKQRVAIARALVKKPEIIMAGEPTGALDSNTGRQVLETLKKLSSDKLVIVVSHDREFAENYGDRIIELADGRVISDMERGEGSADIVYRPVYSGNTIELPMGYHLTEADRENINRYIDDLKNGKLSISIATDNIITKGFTETDVTKIKKQDGSKFKLIKSKLPFKNALKMGKGALGYKKFRLALTILLSCVSFAFFGLADTFAAFTDKECRTNTLYDNGYDYVSVSKMKYLGEGKNATWQGEGFKISQDNLDELNKATGVKMEGVYMPDGVELKFDGQVNPNVQLTETEYNVFNKNFSGIAEITQEKLDDLGFKILSGKLPNGKNNEIAVSEYVLEIFKRTYYADGTYYKTNEGEMKPNYFTIKAARHLVGRFLDVNGTRYTITAVIDTGFDLDRYLPLTEFDEKVTDAEQMENDSLKEEFDTASFYSFAQVMMVGDGFIDSLIGEGRDSSKMTGGELRLNSSHNNVTTDNLIQFKNVDKSKVLWVNGEQKDLGENEIIVTTDALTFVGYDKPKNNQEAIAKLKNAQELTAFIKYYLKDSELHSNKDGTDTFGKFKIVGIMEPTSSLYGTIVCHDYLFLELAEPGNNIYDFAVGEMPDSKGEIKELVDYCYEDDSKIQLWIRNSATWNLDNVTKTLDTYAQYFLFIGIGLAIFAAIMLANFISTSISYKREEIGILRAIGARGKDVFTIFFTESAIIAIINFILSAVIVAVATVILNGVLRGEFGLMITILNYNVRQILLLLALSGLVAFASSYLPVKRVAAMKPIDAIRNK